MTHAVFALLLLLSASAHSAVKPKYGPAGSPKATPLSASSQYFRDARHPAPDFWALIPYYVPQRNGYSCSVATVAMLVNAARAGKALAADDRLVTQEELLEKVKAEDWKKRVNDGLFAGSKGVTLEQLARIAEASLKAYGFREARAEVRRFGPTELAALRDLLKSNEASAGDFLLLNFLQERLTDDAKVGHIAPLGAYDAERDAVLVLDPDREWYEPYWVSAAALLDSLQPHDSVTGKGRGLVHVRPAP